MWSLFSAPLVFTAPLRGRVCTLLGTKLGPPCRPVFSSRSHRIALRHNSLGQVGCTARCRSKSSFCGTHLDLAGGPGRWIHFARIVFGRDGYGQPSTPREAWNTTSFFITRSGTVGEERSGIGPERVQ